MQQLQLPFFPDGVTEINDNLAFIKKDNKVTYLYGHLPVFTHDTNDLKSFRMITSQFYVNGSAKQSEIAKAFGVSNISIKRAVKLYKDKGIPGFYEDRKTRGPLVLTPSVIEQAQKLFDEGLTLSEVAEKLGIKNNTLYKAVKNKRLHNVLTKKEENETCNLNNIKSKSDRSIEDSEAPMGMGATNTLDRMAASIGEMDGADPKFLPSIDVPNGGVLLSLPALLATGLLNHTEKYFKLPKGYYRLDSIFLLMSFLALARIKTIEDLRYVSPGEWGKLLGLDRIPEAKTLREKIGILSDNNHPSQWGAELSKDWMESSTGTAILYVDGHVRVYHGEQTKLPKHYVARQKLCLRATVDYWVNAMDGQPFFVINKEVDPGLIQVLEGEIIPRLEEDLPVQYTLEQLDAEPFLNRFTIIFDREGYSPDFFKKMRKKRIACLTYHKYPGEKWSEEEFVSRQVTLASGHVVEMKLAERGTFLAKTIWVREIRKLSDSGHQTAVISTDYKSNLEASAAAMFARWSQENFFKYMAYHFNLNRLIDYSTEEIPETIEVVNPEYRKLDTEIRKAVSMLNHRRAKFSSITLKGEIEPKKMESFQQMKGDLHEEISRIEKELIALKSKRKEIKRHISIAELPEEERFSRLSTQSKYLIDTIKMIAYRAETSMANVLRKKMSHPDEARSLVRSIFNTEADLLPDHIAGLLTVRLHQPANRKSAELILNLCDQLNATETVFPGTNLRLFYELVSHQNP